LALPNSALELARVLDRIEQDRAVMHQEIRAGMGSAPCAEDRLGCAFRPGARVFDRVTGQEGTVIAGARENLIVPTSQRDHG